MQDPDKKRERLSALVDGQLRAEEFGATLDWLGEAQEARLSWHAYHVVGDVLRSGEALVSARDGAFMARLQLALQQEKPLKATVDATNVIASHALSADPAGLSGLKKVSANEGFFGARMVVGLASLALVCVVGWQAVSIWDAQPGAVQLARLAAPVVNAPVASQQPGANTDSTVMLRDPQLDALLAAHKQFGGTSALQMPAGFLRNATFEGSAR